MTFARAFLAAELEPVIQRSKSIRDLVHAAARE
jgi:hypothetical protein